MTDEPPPELPAEPDDRSLLDAWKRGDRERGNLLFRRHIRGVSRFFRTKVPDAAEDLTQSTFLALADRAAKLPDVPFRAYLFGVARNQLLMYLRTKVRADARFDPLTWSAPETGASPMRLVQANQQQRAVAIALQRIPVDYQIALELHYFEGLGVAEVADVLERPSGTIKSLLSRGRDLLREQLDAADLLASAVDELDRWMRTLPDVLGGDEAG